MVFSLLYDVPDSGDAKRAVKPAAATPVAGQNDDVRYGIEQIITVANVITVLRLLLVPLAFSVLVNGGHDILAFMLFAVAGASDFLDGLIARKTNTVTEIGKAIDPLVDRLLIAAGVMGLYLVDRLPLWMLFLLVGRDFFLLFGLFVVRRLGGRIDNVLFIGKATTLALLVGFAGLILNTPLLGGLDWTHSAVLASYLPGFSAEPHCAWIWFVYLGILLSMITMTSYVVIGFRAIAKARRESEGVA